MPIYLVDDDIIELVPETTFGKEGVLERTDLQRLLRANIEVISPETLIISEEFGDWEESRRRIDLLGVDKQANLVVIELKRTEDGGHMELQSIRYAAMVSTLTFERAVDVFGRHLSALGKEESDARGILLEFLGWDTAEDDQFAQDVRIVLASAEFSKELTSSVLWLLDHDIDIRCVRMKPYRLEDRILVDVQQIIPLPEVEEYQIRVREKVQKERESRKSTADFTRYDIEIDGQIYPGMWKRNAIRVICQRVCKSGVKPDEIAALFDWRSNRVWLAVSGTVDGVTFRKLALESGESKFDPRRWASDDDQLVHSQGKTYAFSNQWSKNGWLRAMNLLKDRYPQLNIGFSPIL
jgi:hypothetical protein